MNRGLSGYNTSNGLKLLPEIFPAPTPGGPRLEYLVRFPPHNPSFLPQPPIPSSFSKSPIRPPLPPPLPVLGLKDCGPCPFRHPWLRAATRRADWLTTCPPSQFILFGANDACVPLPTNFQHVPIDKYKANLVRILTHPNIVAHKPKIFLVTPPPLDEIRVTALDLASGHPSAMRHTKNSAAYSAVVREVAAEQGVTLIDLCKAIMDAAIAKTPDFDPTTGVLGDPETGVRGYLEHLLPDGLHLSSEAYRIFYDLVRPHVGSEWAGTDDALKVGFVLPEWRVAPWLDEDAHLTEAYFKKQQQQQQQQKSQYQKQTRC